MTDLDVSDSRAHVLSTAPQSFISKHITCSDKVVHLGSLQREGLGSLPEMCIWEVPSLAPSTRCQSVCPTFLGFLKTIVLCQPLSVGHVDVFFKLRMLLAQSKSLEEGTNAFVIKGPAAPLKTWLLADPSGMSYFASLTTQRGRVLSPQPPELQKQISSLKTKAINSYMQATGFNNNSLFLDHRSSTELETFYFEGLRGLLYCCKQISFHCRRHLRKQN